ncbi:hypothetical protein [Chelativorans sp. Marseille-P2723]|uniref:hypothetical protein n=1 Tax=Chelativorans sp. Marseille-P2723 TaxID=2709133 RepID=UPI00156DAC13|nr:hypothetical protein [Chelativorans sp. Marseille-P2723]
MIILTFGIGAQGEKTYALDKSVTLRHHDACRIVSPPVLPSFRQIDWLATHNRSEGGFGMKLKTHINYGTANMVSHLTQGKENKLRRRAPIA